MNVIVAGGGVGGLTLAAALQREGIGVRVLERAKEFKPVGAGLTVQVNAMRALAHYGFDAALKGAGRVTPESQIRNWKGRMLACASLAELATQFGQPVLCLHRARLHEALLGLLNPGTVHSGHEVTGFEERESSVRATSSSGETFDADLLVGADGLHSRVRAQLLGDSPERYAGHTSWRGICSANEIQHPDALVVSWGAGKRFGSVPIGHDELYWFGTKNTPAGGRDGDVSAELLANFGDGHALISNVLRRTPPEQIVRTDIYDRAPVTRWTSSRVALLGDAAHPMTPAMGQGACQAIEDAVILAHALGRGGALKDALATYEQRRVARANALVERSLKFGAISQLENPVARVVRDAAMRLFGDRMRTKDVDELYGFSV